MPQDDTERPQGGEVVAQAPDYTLKGLRLGTKSTRALEDMAYRGVPLTIAADTYGIRRDHLTRTMNRPEVRAVYNQIVKSIRDGAAVQAYLRNVELAAGAKSEQVRLEANKWIAGVDGIAALKRVEGRMHHQHTFGGFDFGTFDTIDGTSSDSTSEGDGE